MTGIKCVKVQSSAVFLIIAFAVIMGVGVYSIYRPAAAALSSHLMNPKAPLTKPTNGSISYQPMPFRFEPNVGQIDQPTKFIARGLGYNLYLTAQEAFLVLHPSMPLTENSKSPISQLGDPDVEKFAGVRMRYVGANSKFQVVGQDKLPGTVNHLVGNDAAQWKTKIPIYAKIRYRDLFPGIDAVYYGNSGRLEYDFVIAPGADPNLIKLAFQGPEQLEINESGDLIFSLADGQIHQAKPVIYQVVDGVKRYVDGGYRLNAQGHVVFQIAAYDSGIPLVIDPVLDYASYLGGGSIDQGLGIATDASGFVYITGSTHSTDFPTVIPLQPKKGRHTDVFVTKLDPSDGSLVYSTYLGGKGIDMGQAIAVNPDDEAFVTGYTLSRAIPFQKTFLSSTEFSLNIGATVMPSLHNCRLTE